MCLQDQAKQVFQSLKNNRTYSELELSAWHQKYFTCRKRAARNDRDAGTSRYYPQTRRNVRSKVHSDIKQGNVTADEGRSRRRKSTNDKSKQMRKIQPTTDPIDRTRKRNGPFILGATLVQRCWKLNFNIPTIFL